MKPVLGTFSDPPGQARIDLPRLLETKLLLQAGSGFGKSWALRRILEQTAGEVQQLVVDPEGEFSTLRERHGYVLAAVTGGDVVAHPRTAGLLARRLVEMKVSAVLDISELKKPERRRFVRLFLEELMGLPRAMWTPLLVAIDEAHEFAPEKDESESLGAVVDLATRGRKRGFSMLAATQRIGKFSKDAAAELHNKLVGFTSLDIDVKRAAFSSAWRRVIDRAKAHGEGSGAAFRFHDLRAKSASDDSLAAASLRLGHADARITQRVYRRAPARVKPLDIGRRGGVLDTKARAKRA